MIRLFRLNDDKYFILKRGFEFEGTTQDATMVLLSEGIEEDDVFRAIQGLELGKDVAYFGVDRKLAYMEMMPLPV